MAYSVERVDPRQHRSDIQRLLRSSLKAVPESKFSWIYENNVEGTTACWVVRETNTGRVIGATSLFARRMDVGGEECTAGIAGDFAVDPEHRTLGPALLLLKAALKAVDSGEFRVAYGFPNPQSHPVLRRAGFSVIESAKWYVKPIKPDYFFERRIRSPFLKRVVSSVSQTALRLMAKEMYHRTPSAYEYRPVKTVDERFDELWSGAERPSKLLGVRDRKYLRWKYGASPYGDSHISGLYERATGRLLGYVVYQKRDGHAYVEDLFTSSSDAVLQALLAEFLRDVRIRNVSSVLLLYAGPEPMVRTLRDFGFYERSSRPIVVYTRQGDPAADLVRQCESWYLMEGDSDR